MTQKIQKKLNDSKVARWSALIIVSFTMMMAYFFTDVMGPLEAPLTTKGKLVYFNDGTYLSADSLSKISMQRIDCEEEILVGNTYDLAYADREGEIISEQRTVSSTINGLAWGGDDYGIFSGAYEVTSSSSVVREILESRELTIDWPEEYVSE